MSKWGIGPRITVAMLLAALLAGIATWLWPAVSTVRVLPQYVAIPCGLILLAVGLPLWRFGVPAVMRAYQSDRLVTTGVFGIVRNPIYAAWIVFNVPGIALVYRSWLLLLPSLVGYLLSKSTSGTKKPIWRTDLEMPIGPTRPPCQHFFPDFGAGVGSNSTARKKTCDGHIACYR